MMILSDLQGHSTYFESSRMQFLSFIQHNHQYVVGKDENSANYRYRPRSLDLHVVTYKYDSRGGKVFTGACMLFFARYLKTAAAKIIKLDIEMFHNESWKLIYFGV